MLAKLDEESNPTTTSFRSVMMIVTALLPGHGQPPAAFRTNLTTLSDTNGVGVCRDSSCVLESCHMEDEDAAVDDRSYKLSNQ